MAYRFKASKFRNIVPRASKKEDCISDLYADSPTIIHGSRIAASSTLVACATGSNESGKITVFQLDAKGRLGGSNNGLGAHSGEIFDIAFSPFNHEMLATSSADGTLKLWNFDVDDISNDVYPTANSAILNFPDKTETINLHPEVDSIICVTTGKTLKICDLNEMRVFIDMGLESPIQSCAWRKNSSHLAATLKSGQLAVIDPRTKNIHQSFKCHENVNKGSKVVWVKDTDNLLTTGFTRSRDREVKFWDVRSPAVAVQAETFGSGSGVLKPLYDDDTGLLMLCGKGDANITCLEIDASKSTPVSQVAQHMYTDQTIDVCSVPKFALDTMDSDRFDGMACEVVRTLQLSQRQISRLSWTVNRRSIQGFPSDLFPDTASDEPAMRAQEWKNGANEKGLTRSLDPLKMKQHAENKVSQPAKTDKAPKIEEKTKIEQKPTVELKPEITSKPAPVAKPEAQLQKIEEKPQPMAKPVKTFTGVRAAKYRHWVGKVAHESKQITNVGPISLSMPVSGDMFKANKKRAAVPLAGSGGKLAIFDLNKPGRMTPDNSVTLVHDGGVVTFAWNPFNDDEIAVGTDLGDVYVWNMNDVSKPTCLFEDHETKITTLCYHPLASNLLASCSSDGDVHIWNKENCKILKTIQHDCELLCMAWSFDGRYLATVGKDTQIRLYEPQKGEEPIQVGPGVISAKATRMMFVENDKYIALSGFSKNGRDVTLHETFNLAQGMVSEHSFATAPSVLVPFYDSDSSTLFLTGKGDGFMFSLQVEDGQLFELSSFKSDSPHQAFAFLDKSCVDPRKVEFLQAWRLGKSTLDQVSITVPRVKMEYFQDDLFPDTAVTWEPMLSATEWIKGKNVKPKYISLRPSDMKMLSEAPVEAPKPKKYESYNVETYKTDEEKKEELLAAMSGKLDLDKELEQDTMDGVDEDEWDDY